MKISSENEDISLPYVPKKIQIKIYIHSNYIPHGFNHSFRLTMYWYWRKNSWQHWKKKVSLFYIVGHCKCLNRLYISYTCIIKTIFISSLMNSVIKKFINSFSNLYCVVEEIFVGFYFCYMETRFISFFY